MQLQDIKEFTLSVKIGMYKSLLFFIDNAAKAEKDSGLTGDKQFVFLSSAMPHTEATTNFAGSNAGNRTHGEVRAFVILPSVKLCTKHINGVYLHDEFR